MKFALIAAIMAIAMPAPALAADWVLASKDADGNKFYIDRQSIRTMPNGYKRAWVQAYYGKIEIEGSTGYKSFEEFDCAESRSRTLKDIFLKGEEVALIDDAIGNWKYIAPESNKENILYFACSGKR